MSVSDFVSLFVRTATSGRLSLSNAVAAVLATCILCVAVSGGNAASNNSTEFAAMPFLAPASPDGIDEPSSTSFINRFVECPKTSLAPDVLARPVIHLPLTSLTTASLPESQKIVPAADPIVGTASMYNPNDPNDRDSGDQETASGERYDAESWTAAIRIDLREQFGGVRSGESYQAGFALVQSGDKQAIIRINDVGPLKPGRIIDFNERTMRYFDPTLQAGLIKNVSVTPLAGRNWALGPVSASQPVSVANLFDQ
jgi:rare lipoprotein A